MVRSTKKSMIGKAKHVTLLFAKAKTNIKKVLKSKKFNNYYIVRQIPILELLTHENLPFSVLSETIGLTFTSDWLEQLRRPINYGDIICINTDIYMLLSDDEIKKYGIVNNKEYEISKLAQFPKINAVLLK